MQVSLLSKYKLDYNECVQALSDNTSADLLLGPVQPDQAPYAVMILESSIDGKSGVNSPIEGLLWSYNFTTGVISVTPQFNGAATGVICKIGVLFKR